MSIQHITSSLDSSLPHDHPLRRQLQTQRYSSSVLLARMLACQE